MWCVGIIGWGIDENIQVHCKVMINGKYKSELDKMEQLEQHQGSLVEQLQILRTFANKLGLYDAADYLRL